MTDKTTDKGEKQGDAKITTGGKTAKASARPKFRVLASDEDKQTTKRMKMMMIF